MEEEALTDPMVEQAKQREKVDRLLAYQQELFEGRDTAIAQLLADKEAALGAYELECARIDTALARFGYKKKRAPRKTADPNAPPKTRKKRAKK